MPDICHNNRQLCKRNSTGTLLVHNMYYIPATNVNGLGQRTAVLFPEFRFSLKHKSQLDFNFATVVRFPNPRAGTYGDLLYNISRNGATPFFCHITQPLPPMFEPLVCRIFYGCCIFTGKVLHMYERRRCTIAGITVLNLRANEMITQR